MVFYAFLTVDGEVKVTKRGPREWKITPHVGQFAFSVAHVHAGKSNDERLSQFLNSC